MLTNRKSERCLYIKLCNSKSFILQANTPSKREMTATKREAIQELVRIGYCHNCLRHNLPLCHGPSPMEDLCLVCEDNFCTVISHPRCVDDDFFCPICEKTEHFRRHTWCDVKRRNFMLNLNERTHHLLFPRPFKFFKK